MRRKPGAWHRLALSATALGCFALAAPGYGQAPDEPGDAAGALLTLDYLMIRGNEGGSAGGHAAIRFGDETFHFEHADGLLRLGRDDSERFQYVYRTLQNRDMELSRVAVSADTWARLQEAFERRVLVQERQLAIESEIRGDAILLATLQEGRRGAQPHAASYDVRGAGFFEAAPLASGLADASTHALAALRLRIESLHGPDFLARRRAEVEQALASVSPRPVSVDAIELTADRYPVVPPSFSRRSEDWLAARLALERLAQPYALRVEALAPGTEALALGPDDRQHLGSAAVALREDMALLVASRREDWGFALLLGMARLASFEASLRSGHWVLLDPFPAASEAFSIDERQRELLAGLLVLAEADFERARREFYASGGFRELAWNALEAAAARWLELRRAVAGAATIRIHTGAMIPEAPARVTGLPQPSGNLGSLLAQSQAAARRYHERLKALHGYDLVSHNCVSEIFRTLEVALGAELESSTPDALDAGVREESIRQLGGYVHPVAGLNFIPFVSSLRVRERWRVAETISLPSYRRYRLAEMAASEPPLLVALRESNVFTARTHRAGDSESFFVFFTDTQVPLRPLFGVVNVGAGLVRSALGLLALPIDRGRGLRSGLWGVLFSLPELAFQNIRKGYNDYVPPGERPPPG